MGNIRIHYKVGETVQVDLGDPPNKIIELKISSKETNRLGIPMYGFEGKGDLRVGPNFILDQKLKRFPTMNEIMRG